MKNKIFTLTNIVSFFFGGIILNILSSVLNADDATPEPYRSQVKTELKVNIDKDINQVHFVNTNNDPDVYTKVYRLKFADPYELRPYLRKAVSSKRVNENDTKVECIKYNDGTSMLVISAEDYRFEKDQHGGMNLDQIVKTLDKPGITSSPGHRRIAFFPKYMDAGTFVAMLKNSGLNIKGDSVELDFGKDSIQYDSELNAFIAYLPPYSIKTVERMIKLYDVPPPEVRIRYTVYEIAAENDGKIGVDFQAWKNGPGNNIFNAAGRYSYNWTGSATLGFPDSTGSNTTSFIRFNPKWNTKYIDFLAAKSKAKIITSGEITVMNNKTGIIQNKTTIPRIADGDKLSNQNYSGEYFILESEDFWREGTAANAVSRDGYKIVAKDENGNVVTTTDFHGSIVVTKLNMPDSHTAYFIKIQSPTHGAIIVDGITKGKKNKRCYDLHLYQCVRSREVVGLDSNDNIVYSDSYSWVEQTGMWQDDRNLIVMKGMTRITEATSYGFRMSVTPRVCRQSTTVDVKISNISLTGFMNDGRPRTSESSFQTRLMVANTGSKFVIGGVEKKTVVKSVSKIPWVGSLPLIGWLFGSDAESTKKSQIVTVLECVPVMPDTQASPSYILNKIKNTVKNAGETNDWKRPNYGFDQFIFDKEKNKEGPDELP